MNRMSRDTEVITHSQLNHLGPIMLFCHMENIRLKVEGWGKRHEVLISTKKK